MENWKTDRLNHEYDRLVALDETDLHPEAREVVREKVEQITSILYQRQIERDESEGINDVWII